MTELTNKCEKTAQLFDQRSSTRADELKALSDATAELQKGAVPNFSSNKKLNDLQTGVKLSKAEASSPVAFVQIQSVQHDQSRQQAVVERVQKYLDSAADRTGSRVLSALAVRVTVAKDHFVKVRGLIKDLIQKLKDDAKAEASQKRNCDLGMQKAIDKRDKANAKIEQNNTSNTKFR
jgi:hypothetical protein